MRIVLLFSLLVLGCRVASPLPENRPATTADVARDAQSPIQCSLRLVDGESPLTLELSVTKLLATETPLAVSVRLPPGVELNPVSLDPIAASETGVVTRRVQLRYSSVPSSDAFFVVDTQGKSFGYHAELPYRFGRPEPTTPAPVRSDTTLKVGGKTLGRPIEVQPGTQK